MLPDMEQRFMQKDAIYTFQHTQYNYILILLVTSHAIVCNNRYILFTMGEQFFHLKMHRFFHSCFENHETVWNNSTL